MCTALPSKRSLLSALLLAGLFCLTNCARHLTSLDSSEPTKSVKRAFDYLLLVRQWPGSYCSEHTCPLLRARGYHFTIHGLWPNYDGGGWPQFCDASYKFDETQLEDLMDELEDEWPSVYDSDEDFWEHEWSKHGTCALNVFPSEHSYFKTILMLHRRYNLSDALGAADIVPDPRKVYRTQDLMEAINKAYGVRPLVRCDGTQQLSEIWMCFDKGLRPFDCDPSHEGNACKKVVIPPLRGGQARNVTGPAEGQTNGRTSYDRAPYTRRAVEDSIYWLLGPETSATTETGSDGAADAAASAATEDGPEAGAVSGAGRELYRSYLYYDDTIPVVQPEDDRFDGSSSVVEQPEEEEWQLRQQFQLQQQFQEFELEEIEQRLRRQQDDELPEQMAVAAAAAATDPRVVPGAGALAVLAALAERVMVQLHQQLLRAGTGSSRGNSVGVLPDNTFAGAAVGGEQLQQPNAGGAEGFVWSSKLRSAAGGEVAFSADEAEERAAIGSGGAATTTVTVVAEDWESGPELWEVRGVWLLPSGAVRVGVGGVAAPPMWVVVLLAFQLTCVVVVTLMLLVVAGMALAGAKWGAGGTRDRPMGRGVEHQSEVVDGEFGDWRGEEQGDAEEEAGSCWLTQQQPQPQHSSTQQLQQQWWGGCTTRLWAAQRRAGGNGDGLVEPLLSFSDAEHDGGDDEDDEEGSGGGVATPTAPPKIHFANRVTSAAEEEEEEEREWRQQRQQQQQGEWQQNPLLRSGDMWPGGVAALAAEARPSTLNPQQVPYAPVC